MQDVSRVAVVIPCYRDGALLVEAVRSIDEDEPVEVVIVDDGSRDGTTLEAIRVAEEEGARLVRHERNLGLIAARMSGLEATHAPYVFPLDADDLAVAGGLGRMADRLDAAPGAAVCLGDYAEFGTQNVIRAVPERLDPYRLAFTNEYPVSALFRRTALERVGAWGARAFSASPYADWNLWLTLACQGDEAVHMGPGVITFRKRFTGQSMLDEARSRHREMYRELRERHPEVFGQLGAHRRRSDLGRARRLLYPLVYGGRRRFPFERRVKLLLDRLGVWTLRR
jgi:glycosyltransferase involved in cell wall biosynthesis